jgi:hypothetical protein
MSVNSYQIDTQQHAVVLFAQRNRFLAQTDALSGTSMIAPNLLQGSVCLELVVVSKSTRSCPVSEVPSVDLRRLGMPLLHRFLSRLLCSTERAKWNVHSHVCAYDCTYTQLCTYLGRP